MIPENITMLKTHYRILKTLYEKISYIAPHVSTDYEGSITKLGDTVLVRPKADIVRGIESMQPLVVDREIPLTWTFDTIFTYLLDNILWADLQFIVFQIVEGRLIWGCKYKEDE